MEETIWRHGTASTWKPVKTSCYWLWWKIQVEAFVIPPPTYNRWCYPERRASPQACNLMQMSATESTQRVHPWRNGETGAGNTSQLPTQETNMSNLSLFVRLPIARKYCELRRWWVFATTSEFLFATGDVVNTICWRAPKDGTSRIIEPLPAGAKTQEKKTPQYVWGVFFYSNINFFFTLLFSYFSWQYLFLTVKSKGNNLRVSAGIIQAGFPHNRC